MADQRRDPSVLHAAAAFGAFLAFVFVLAAAAGWVTQVGPGSWYGSLEKPSLTPPDIVFPIVWNILYLMMATAGWLVWYQGGGLSAVGKPLAIFGTQMALNLSWSVIFFGLHRPGLAALEILVLLGAIAFTIKSFAPISRTAAVMLAPYFFWVLFAAYLNSAVWLLNGS